jgi:hypothetical protein
MAQSPLILIKMVRYVISVNLQGKEDTLRVEAEGLE